MDSFNLVDSLKQIFKRVDIKLPHGNVDDESLVSIDYYKQRKWKLVLHDECFFTYMHVDFFVQALQKLQIKQVETFLYSWEDGIRYFKSMESKYQVIKDIFYNIDTNDKNWSKPEVVVSSILITNKTMDFIVFVDSYREQFYFYGENDFINSVMPVSGEAFNDYYEAYYEVYEHEPLHIDYLKWLWENYIR